MAVGDGPRGVGVEEAARGLSLITPAADVPCWLTFDDGPRGKVVVVVAAWAFPTTAFLELLRVGRWSSSSRRGEELDVLSLSELFALALLVAVMRRVVGERVTLIRTEEGRGRIGDGQ